MGELVSYDGGELNDIDPGITNNDCRENRVITTLLLPKRGPWFQLKENLKSEILELIAKHNHERTAPPFSPAELIVMGAICLNPNRTPLHKIYRWIVETFVFYRKQAMEEYFSALEPTKRNKVGWVVDLDPALSRWEAPLTCADKSGIVNRGRYNQHLAVPIAAARIFLQKWMEPERDGRFPLLELPAELRVRIYELVFAFPKSGIDVRNTQLYRSGAWLKQREVDTYMDGFTCQEMYGYATTAPMCKVLALLSVNKQIYQEAVPVFYNINLFHFPDTSTFSRLYRRLPSSRWCHLKDVVLEFNFGHLENGHVTVKEWEAMTLSLSTLHLRHLRLKYGRTLGIHSSWQNLPKFIRLAAGLKDSFTELWQLPGMRSLAVACYKATKFEIKSDYPLIEEYIESVVQRCKAGEPIEEAPKKPSKSSKKIVRLKVPRLAGFS